MLIHYSRVYPYFHHRVSWVGGCCDKDADGNILRLHSCSRVAKAKGRTQLDVQIPEGGTHMYVCRCLCMYVFMATVELCARLGLWCFGAVLVEVVFRTQRGSAGRR